MVFVQLGRSTQVIEKMRERDLLFVGGGHTHALAIRTLAMRPIRDVRITLVSEQTLTPYSGMLPGFVAGHYSYEEAHIDLNRLCQWANIRYIRGRVYGLDVQNKVVHVESVEGFGQFDIAYDTLSLDVGSTPDKRVAGADTYAVGVKPVSQFAATWHGLLEKSQEQSGTDWGVIGAGAGGVELVLAMAHRVSQLQYHLIYPHAHVLPGYPDKVVRVVEDRLKRAGVSLHPSFRVAEVNASGLRSDDNKTLALDQSIWCTGASAAEWLRQSDLQTSERGFVAVDEFLRSHSHPEVFAVGDCADMLHDPRPKAGVYAVRQAPFLVENLRAAFRQGRGKAVRLQSDFLSLLSLGNKSAVGCRNGFVAAGAWVWKLKDHIDKKFMRRLNEPGAKLSMDSDSEMPMHCAGCGSKLGPALLQSNLKGLSLHTMDSVTPALNNAEDASLWRVSDGMAAVQSIDGFRSFTADHWRFGKICVNHALSDLYAMGATPVTAQVWINIAFAHPRLQQRDHRLLMTGIADALQEQQVVLAGGHSTEGMEDHIAIVANGEAYESALWRKNTLRVGDVLVLTKPIGTGVILAADMQATASSIAVDAAFDSMMQSNREAAAQLVKHRPSAVTDITGFGVLGHLLEMIGDHDNGIGAVLELGKIPLLPGALTLAEQGVRSTLYPQLQPLLLRCSMADSLSQRCVDLLIDPQTSGGLLIAIAPEEALRFVEALGGDAAIVGRIEHTTAAVVIE
jgi:selenide,water dikinase